MQVPGARHRADDVVTALDDHAGNVANLSDILDQIIVGRKEAVVHEVVTLDAGEGLRESRIGKLLDRLGIKKEFRRRALPNGPRARRFKSYLLVIAGQPLMISADHVVTFSFGNDFQKLFPNVGEDPTAAFLIEPFDLIRPAEKDSAQHEFGRALGMLLSISKRQSAAPRSAEHLPFLYAEMLAQFLNIR